MRLRWFGLATFCVALVSVAPVSAAPSNVRLQVRDADTSEQLADGARISGSLTLAVHAESSTGMRRVRVEAHPADDEKWYCVAEADTRNDGITIDIEMQWDTRNWPAPESGSGCTHTLPHIHGTPTPNAAMEMRAVAIDLVDDQQVARSSVFTFDLANPATAPAWVADPRLDADTRRVALSWAPGAEPDLIEYLVERTGPDGTTAMRVDARTPEQDGCSLLAALAINCTDALPAAGGTYTYAVTALRPGGSARCAGRNDCITGAASEVRTLVAPAARGSTSEPTLESTPTDTGSTTPSTIGPSPEISASATDAPTVVAEPAADSGTAGASAFPVVATMLAGLAGAIGGVLAIRKRRNQAQP